MKLGLIGCGKMGRSLLEGAINAEQVKPSDCTVHNRSLLSQDAIVKELGTKSADSPASVVSATDIVLLCTKPKDMLAMLESIDEDTAHGTLFISVAAGLSLDQLESSLPKDSRVIRCMPNTPAMIGEGAAAFAKGSHTTTADVAAAESLLAATGSISEVAESLLDAVTGVSGSGPAYVYTFIEALADGGVAEGLPRDIAMKLAVQTVRGAAGMVEETGLHPAVLRDMVTSPGGTTIEAVTSLENDGFRPATIKAVRTAAEKSRQLRAQS